VFPAEAVCDKVVRQYDQMSFDDGDLALEWDAQMRLVETLDPSYKS